MVPPAVVGAEPRFVNQQGGPFYGYVNPQSMMNVAPFPAFHHPMMGVNAYPHQHPGPQVLPPAGRPEPGPTHGWTPRHAAKGLAKGRVHGTEQGPLSEKESKELKRKKANRESARRSKLRKKEEFESLARKVDVLSTKGIALRTEIAKMEGVLETLEEQNASLKKELGRLAMQGGKGGKGERGGEERERVNQASATSSDCTNEIHTGTGRDSGGESDSDRTVE